ncbi:hypothetical protein D5086_026371 [Populus alba]|uniref:Uncharacterized protein n=1 Tax=Populus alba TaxID=43335 RepID=A0ACC4B3B1_POPAL
MEGKKKGREEEGHESCVAGGQRQRSPGHVTLAYWQWKQDVNPKANSSSLHNGKCQTNAYDYRGVGILGSWVWCHRPHASPCKFNTVDPVVRGSGRWAAWTCPSYFGVGYHVLLDAF